MHIKYMLIYYIGLNGHVSHNMKNYINFLKREKSDTAGLTNIGKKISVNVLTKIEPFLGVNMLTQLCFLQK